MVGVVGHNLNSRGRPRLPSGGIAGDVFIYKLYFFPKLHINVSRGYKDRAISITTKRGHQELQMTNILIEDQSYSNYFTYLPLKKMHIAPMIIIKLQRKT